MPTNGNSGEKDPETGYITPTQAGAVVVFGAASKKRFIEQMEVCGNLAETCDIIGIGMTTYYKHLQADEAFARDVGICLRRMAGKLEGVMYKNGQRPQGYLDRITWLRKHFPEWNPKSSVSVSSSDSGTVEELFGKLEADGKIINVEPETE